MRTFLPALVLLLATGCLRGASTPTDIDDCEDNTDPRNVFIGEAVWLVEEVCNDMPDCELERVLRPAVAVCVSGFRDGDMWVEYWADEDGEFPAYVLNRRDSGFLTRRSRSEMAIVHSITGELVDFQSWVDRPDRNPPPPEPCCIDG